MPVCGVGLQRLHSTGCAAAASGVCAQARDYAAEEEKHLQADSAPDLGDQLRGLQLVRGGQAWLRVPYERPSL
ncbi:hypothetical protein CVT25_004557 [Psilocybe cyanescens]|uniref:Uncharacterized protein n=1 Tax=Psilocybe cyanescens TaxID=93625 RepID=A0A409XMH3_PSICY|nr:hypothetical protein CVT25_004557 [Psilocybe cyanescens]